MKNTKYHLLGVCILFNILSYAQERQVNFNSIPFNYLYSNAAYTGEEWFSKVSLFTQVQEQENIQLLSISHSLLAKHNDYNKGGIGGYVLRYDSFDYEYIDAKLSFVYHKRVFDGRLGLGVRGGMLYAQQEQIRINQPTLDLGVWYKKANYYFGFALNNSILNHNKDTLIVPSPSVVLNMGYEHHWSGSFRSTGILLVNTSIEKATSDIGVTTSYNQKYWAGVYLRQLVTNQMMEIEGVILSLGIELFKRTNIQTGRISHPLKIGYSVGRMKQYLSHELYIAYVLPFKDKRNPPPIRRSYTRPYS